MSRIPFVDLGSQYRRLKSAIDARIETVLDHGRYVMGPEVDEFERRLGDFVGAQTIGCSSGTDALLLGLMTHEVGPGDAVFLPAFTFPATAEVVLLLRAEPVFVEVDRRTFNIDPDDLEQRVERVEREGRLRARAVIPVDLFGLPADHLRISQVAERHDLAVIDDAAQALGARTPEGKVGSLAPLTATSFFPAKPLGCYGDGGAVFTTDPELAARIRSLRVHGQGSEKYELARIGINGRLDTLQAAILLAKLDVFPDELRAREELAGRYDRDLAEAVTVPSRIEGVASAWAQYSILVEKREPVLESLRDAGIPFGIYYPMPLHLQAPYRSAGQGPGSLPVTEYLCEHILSLPMHPYLAPETAREVAEAVCVGTRRS